VLAFNISLVTCNSRVLQIVQTFFIASIAGSITEALSKVQTAGDVFRYLAITLPPQAVFFIQLVLISTVIGIGAELLRTTALMQSGLRKFLGPRVTHNERDMVWMGLRPLSNPRFCLFAQILAKINLFFMILFTFAVLAPFICFVMAFAFLMLEICARHQLIYIYPILDSGGKLWLHSVKILLICVLIAEGILMSYMGLVKARAQFYMMIPLLVVTFLFQMYLLQRHFNVASHLSSEDCVAFDVCNDLNNTTAQEIFGTPFLQPALRDAQNDEQRTIEEEEGRLPSSRAIE
jgi:Calcium-dependent channel, 7TM region, putative phosphate